jgi:hypothetical protein
VGCGGSGGARQQTQLGLQAEGCRSSENAESTESATPTGAVRAVAVVVIDRISRLIGDGIVALPHVDVGLEVRVVEVNACAAPAGVDAQVSWRGFERALQAPSRPSGAPVSMTHTTGPLADPVLLSHAAGAPMRPIAAAIELHAESLGTLFALTGQSTSA